MEDIEPFERYTVGDYYPVRIGERFCSARYHIVHKLGHGSYSTIWLARDEILAKYVAIKFCVSGLDRPSESTILKALWDEGRRGGEEHIGATLFPELLDEFEVEGPEIRGTKRKHRCLVTTPAMMSIAEAREASPYRYFQLPVARAIAAQIIQAVAFMHSRGIVHGGV